MSDILLHNMSKSSEVQHNELPSIKFLGNGSPYRGGSSPLSRYPLYQNRAASKAWDLLAKRLVLTSESTQSKSLESIVTPTLGLFSEELMYSKIPPMDINIHDQMLPIIHESGINGEPKYENTTYSGRYAPGRAGGKGIILPNYRGRGNNTHSRKSVIRVLSNGGYGYLRQVGETNLSHGHRSKKDNSVCPSRVMNVDRCGKIRQKNGNSGDTVPGKLLRISFRNVDYSSGFNRLESWVGAISQRETHTDTDAHPCLMSVNNK